MVCKRVNDEALWLTRSVYLLTNNLTVQSCLLTLFTLSNTY